MSIQTEALDCRNDTLARVDRQKLIASLEYETRAAEAYANAYPNCTAVSDYCKGKLTVLNELLYATRNGAWS